MTTLADILKRGFHIKMPFAIRFDPPNDAAELLQVLRDNGLIAVKCSSNAVVATVANRHDLLALQHVGFERECELETRPKMALHRMWYMGDCAPCEEVIPLTSICTTWPKYLMTFTLLTQHRVGVEMPSTVACMLGDVLSIKKRGCDEFVTPVHQTRILCVGDTICLHTDDHKEYQVVLVA